MHKVPKKRLLKDLFLYLPLHHTDDTIASHLYFLSHGVSMPYVHVRSYSLPISLSPLSHRRGKKIKDHKLNFLLSTCFNSKHAYG